LYYLWWWVVFNLKKEKKMKKIMYCNISDCNCFIMAMGYSNGPTLIYCAYDVFIYGEKSENSEKSEQKTGQCVPGQARGQCVQHTVYRYYTLLDHSKWRRLPESEQLVLSLLVTVAAAECGIWSIFMPMICSV
jgi:hypothetical protein